jgi:hypothetical protein
MVGEAGREQVQHTWAKKRAQYTAFTGNKTAYFKKN